MTTGEGISPATAEMAQEGRRVRRLFDVQLPLLGREVAATVFSIRSGKQERTVLRGNGFRTRTNGGVEDLARTMGPVPGNRIRAAHRVSRMEGSQGR